MAIVHTARPHSCIALLATVLLLTQASTAPAQVITSTWNGATGNWIDPALWTPAVPNNGSPSGTSYNASVAGAGTLTLNAPITIEQLIFRGGTITGTNSLTMNDLTTWSGGTFAGTGATSANGGASLTGATAPMVLDARGLTVGGTSSTWSGGTIQLTNGGSLTNAAGSVLTATGNNSITRISGAATVVNNGTLRKQTGTGTTTIGPNVTFTNNGLVDVQSGTLGINFVGPGGTSAGATTVASGATLLINFPSNGSYDFAAGSSLSGPGLFRMTASSPNPFNTGGGFVTVRGTFDMGAVEVTDASLTLTNGGRTGPLTLTRDFGLNVSNTLTVNGLLTWEGSQSTIGSAGMIPGPVPDVVANAGMVFSGRAGSINERLENVRLILNGGTSTMSGGGLVLGTRAALVNASGSTLVNAGWQFGTSSASFENAGVLRVSSSSIVSSTVSSSGVGQFVNAGTMEVTGRFNFPTVTGAPPNGMVNRGVLTVNSGGTVSGSVVNTGSGVLRGSGALEGGPFIFGPGTTLSPGVGVGVLSTTGPVSLSGGATFLAQLNGNTPGSGYDRLDLGGTGTIDLGGATLATSLGYQPSPADLVVLLLGSGSSPQVSGTFTNALLGSVIYVGTFDGVNYGARVNYTANSMFLDNFQVVAIPEPTSLALATLALVGGVAVRRRRKSESK